MPSAEASPRFTRATHTTRLRARARGLTSRPPPSKRPEVLDDRFRDEMLASLSRPQLRALQKLIKHVRAAAVRARAYVAIPPGVSADDVLPAPWENVPPRAPPRAPPPSPPPGWVAWSGWLRVARRATAPEPARPSSSSRARRSAPGWDSRVDRDVAARAAEREASAAAAAVAANSRARARAPTPGAPRWCVVRLGDAGGGSGARAVLELFEPSLAAALADAPPALDAASAGAERDGRPPVGAARVGRVLLALARVRALAPGVASLSAHGLCYEFRAPEPPARGDVERFIAAVALTKRLQRRSHAEAARVAHEGPPFVIDETVSIPNWPRSLTRPKCPLLPFPHEYHPLQNKM